ncbi:caspase family protein [Limibacter armeniacum]|uniref:caspase family protein n=1 Tax=Limibacter armeniacum TaxID=466084 RepID=UPI002FE52F70
MMRFSFIGITLLCSLLSCFVFGQEPNIVLQTNISSGIESMVRSQNGAYYLIQEGSVQKDFALYDQASNILLGKVHVDHGSNQISNAVSLFDSGIFWVASTRDIVAYNPIDSSADTVFNLLEYPEYIYTFQVLPWDQDKVVIATKIYPEHVQMLYETSDMGRLFIFDRKLGTITKSVDLDYEVTALEVNADRNELLLGNNKGAVYRFDTSLNVLGDFALFDKPVFYLKCFSNDRFLVIPSSQEDYSFGIGEGKLRFGQVVSGTQIKEVQLPVDKPKEQENGFMTYNPSNVVKSVAFDGESFYVNYGYRKVIKISTTDFELKSLNMDAYESVSSILLNQDKSGLVFSHGRLGMINIETDLSLYDLKKDKVSFQFPKYANLSQENAMSHKVQHHVFHDVDGNVILIRQLAPKNAFLSNETLLLYASNRLLPKTLKLERMAVYLNEGCSKAVFIQENFGRKRFKVASFESSKIMNDSTQLDFAQLDEQNFLSDIRLYTLPDNNISEIYRTEQSPDNDHLVFYVRFDNDRYGIVSYKLSNGTYSVLAKEELALGTDIAISSSGKFVSFASGGLTKKVKIHVFDLQTNKTVYQKTLNSTTSGGVKFQKGTDTLFYYEYFDEREKKGESRLVSVSDLERKPKLEEVKKIGYIADFCIREGANLLAFDSYDHFGLMDLVSGEVIKDIEVASGVEHMSYHPSIDAYQFDNENEFYLIKSNGETLHYLFYEGNKQLAILNNRYYMAEKTLMPNLGFEYGRKGVQYHDFDLYYNRPDLLLAFMGNKNREYQQVVEKAISKRFARLTGSSIVRSFDVEKKKPTVKLLNKHELPEKTTQRALDIHLKTASENGPVERVHIKVNGVPVFGLEGWQITPTESGEVMIPIELSQGRNMVHLSVEDRDGLRSPQQVFTTFLDDDCTSKTYLITVAVSTFKEEGYDLTYPVKDARDVIHQFKMSIPDTLLTVDSLFNDSLTPESLEQLKMKLTKTHVDDKVILFVAGHGLLDDELDFWYATQEMDFEDPAKKGIAYTAFEQLLSAIPARQKLMLIDACHSGEVDKTSIKKQTEGISTDQGVVRADVSSRGLSNKRQQSKVGSKNSFALMQALFVNLKNQTGIQIISAAAGDSYALESDQWQNGLFTYCMLNGMRDGKADLNQDGKLYLSELKSFMDKEVFRLSNGAQQTTARGENLLYDFLID